MKKTEAISILATSVRPREPKDRARYDEAVKMAIEALKCSEIPNSSDSISRRAAIDAVDTIGHIATMPDGDKCIRKSAAKYTLSMLPAAQPEIIRCKDCKYWRDDHTCHEHSLVSPMCANEYCSRAKRGNDGHID